MLKVLKPAVQDQLTGESAQCSQSLSLFATLRVIAQSVAAGC